ncbi:MAG: flagellar protein FliS [Acidobacteriota bacterium]
MTPTELYYRKTAAASSAGGLGLLIGLFDTLAGDLRRMADAERGQDLLRRCREANHALLVIGHLEDWVTKGSSGELADQLTAFYAELRRNLVLAQAKRSPEMIEEQMRQVLKIREAWQALELHATATSASTSTPRDMFAAPAADASESRSLGWTA